jgi:hypothetical protein
MNVQEMDEAIVRQVVATAIAAGYVLTVFDGEEYPIKECGDAEKVFAAMRATDDDRLDIMKDGRRIGWVYFVYGNTGWDVICDHSNGIEELLTGASALSDQFERASA